MEKPKELFEKFIDFSRYIFIGIIVSATAETALKAEPGVYQYVFFVSIFIIGCDSIIREEYYRKHLYKEGVNFFGYFYTVVFCFLELLIYFGIIYWLYNTPKGFCLWGFFGFYFLSFTLILMQLYIRGKSGNNFKLGLFELLKESLTGDVLELVIKDNNFLFSKGLKEYAIHSYSRYKKQTGGLIKIDSCVWGMAFSNMLVQFAAIQIILVSPIVSAILLVKYTLKYDIVVEYYCNILVLYYNILDYFHDHWGLKIHSVPYYLHNDWNLTISLSSIVLSFFAYAYTTNYEAARYCESEGNIKNIEPPKSKEKISQFIANILIITAILFMIIYICIDHPKFLIAFILTMSLFASLIILFFGYVYDGSGPGHHRDDQATQEEHQGGGEEGQADQARALDGQKQGEEQRQVNRGHGRRNPRSR